MRRIAVVIGVLAASSASLWAETPGGLPPAVQPLMACRAVTQAEQRLACFDKESGALETAVAQKEVVIVDRNQIKQTKRSLFGLSLPKLALFGGKGDEREDQELETTISSASYSQYRWTIRLPDGAKWVQISTDTLVNDPKPGQKIRIRKAALGSYFVNINGQRAIKMRREN